MRSSGVREGMGKSSKQNARKDAEKEAKRESPWEELVPAKEFFQRKDGMGTVMGGELGGRNPAILKAGTVQVGDTGLLTMTYRTFEKEHLSHAQTPQDEPLAFILHGDGVQFKAKFPQIPAGRYKELDWPGKAPKT